MFVNAQKILDIKEILAASSRFSQGTVGSCSQRRRLDRPSKIQGAANMSEIFEINGHIYRAYPTRFYCDGVKILPTEFYNAIRSLYMKKQHY